jgi:DNA invertase Pin-like site-specific DNA recombinase
VKKLIGKKKEIKELLDKRVSESTTACILGVHRLTVTEFVKEMIIHI